MGRSIWFDICGFNIAILIAILVSISEPFLGRRGAAVFAVTGILLYTILVGADASVVRAAIMGIIYLFTQRWLGRPNFAFASLFAAGFLMTLVNPFTLWDVGFQLSFMATLSLMVYADPFSKWTDRQLQHLMSRQQARRVMGILSEAVVITLAAQVLTLPLMVGYFQQLSLISLPANFLILPAQPAVMTWGGLATLVGMVSPALAQPIAWVAWLPLTYTIGLVRLFAAVPYAAVPVNISWGWVLAFYGLIATLTYLAQQEPERRRRLLADLRPAWGMRLMVGGTAVLALLVFSWAATQPDGKLHVAFLDVGQGDAIFIQTPSGRQLLVDGGNDPSVLNDRLGQQMPFWDRHIDIMVATHPDADHVSGLVELYGRYQIGQLITDGAEADASAGYEALLQVAEAQQTPLHRAVAGEVIEIGDGVRLEIVHPGTELDAENRNENSVSFRLMYGNFSLLLTGDVEEKGEAMMLQKGLPLQALVFKAGHHGSRTSSTEPFLAAVQPHIMVVSAGADNRFGHPHPEVLARAAERGTAVLHTAELGTIEVITDGHTMWWQARGGDQ
ncbi:MAG: DNA internalization-related competence protein ComEC/Rec2 [Anaerolineae bacterium]|nr:DNA internalization-related competence protein ComEC/Rec2 [Anaerolineae bacterium]